MAKPAGPTCNLGCKYCFYLDKKSYFPPKTACRMSDQVLEAYTREYIRTNPDPSVVFAWQGGEPTLAGIGFFQQALEYQAKHSSGKQVVNTLQTNGTLLDDKWCGFLAENNFLVGLSLDGPALVHDANRVDRAGKPTHAKVMRALGLLNKHGVDYNVLAAINRDSARQPTEVYSFFKQAGVRFIQFIPIIERAVGKDKKTGATLLSGPPDLKIKDNPSEVTPWSVEPHSYGDFMISIFRDWVRNDVGEIFVMNFEWALAAWAGAGSGVCYLSDVCGSNLIIEHNGDVFSCDHFMYPAYRLGNILHDSLRGMVGSDQQNAFGASKEKDLPAYCRGCEFLFACSGGCPKHRFFLTPDAEPGLNYLCAGLKKFYQYANPYLARMAQLIRSGEPAQKIMESTPS